jgi:hypothetical protein
MHLSVLGVILKHFDGPIREPYQHFIRQLDLGAHIEVFCGTEIG